LAMLWSVGKILLTLLLLIVAIKAYQIWKNCQRQKELMA